MDEMASINIFFWSNISFSPTDSCPQFSPAPHLDGFEPYISKTKLKRKTTPNGVVFLFGGRYRTRTYDLTHCKRFIA